MSIKGKIRQTENLKGSFTLNNQLVSQTVKLSAAGITLGDIENVDTSLHQTGSILVFNETSNQYVSQPPPALSIIADSNLTNNNPGVEIGVDNLSILGTNNEIVTELAGDTLTIGLPNDVIIGNDLTINNALKFDDGTSNQFTKIISTIEETSGVDELPTAAAIINYVNSKDISLSDGSNSISVNLSSEVLTVQGTSNEIEVAASGNTLTIGLPDSISLGTALGVASGGTGLASLVDDSVMIVSNSGISFITSTEGNIIQFNSDGEPVASSIIDGGSY